MLSCGIIGLPNVGKSTLFNALLKKQQALAANYPFTTIEPNVGVVPVPDDRLEKLAEIVAFESFGHLGGVHSATPEESLPSEVPGKKPPVVSATVEFVDIAGLVKGASEGAGLGNKFLSYIREVKIIAHVVRAFDPSTGSGQEKIVRVGTNPKEDYQTIITELILADLQTLIKQKDSKNVKMDPVKKSAIEKLYKSLDSGNPARDVSLTEEEQESVKDLLLLSGKPEIIVLNVEENDYSNDKLEGLVYQYTSILDISADKIIVICAKIESELASLTDEEQKEYLKDLGLEQSGLERLIQKAYETLGLISFLTAGEKEVRAWTLRAGSTALRASGEIHTDFMKKFIKAEVVLFDDFVMVGGWKKARELGKARFEGRDYIVKDGDVIEFKIGS